MAGLQQLQISYDQFQDRLILFIYTQDFQEFRFWLTRRCAQLLWDLLGQLLNSSHKDGQQLQTENQQVTEQIAKEKTQQQPTAAKFATKMTSRPLGEEPILVAGMAAKIEENGTWRLRLDSSTGQSLEIAGDSTIALALCNMIRQTSETAQWQLPFTKAN